VRGFARSERRYEARVAMVPANMQAPKASDSPRRSKRGAEANLTDRLRMTPALGGHGLSAET
jgi:hypothetical protein